MTQPTSIRNSQVGGTHYKDMSIQPWDAMDCWLTYEERVGFYKGNAIKYLARATKKGGIEDIAKAQHYVAKLLEVLKEPPPEKSNCT